MVPEVGATTSPTAQDCTKTIASKVGEGSSGASQVAITVIDTMA